MRASDLAAMKAAIKNELSRRNGFGSVAQYAGAQYDLSKQPSIGEKIRPEYGQKTIDLLLRICDYGDLRKVQLDDPIPKSFSPKLTNYVNTVLAKEQKTGHTRETIALLQAVGSGSGLVPESSSCRGDCTGLCVGSCIGCCNGCSSCAASCGTGCASGCNTTCKGGCWAKTG